MTHRWRKLDVRSALLVVAAAREGLPRPKIAARAGVSRSTLYSWLQRAKAGESPFAELAEAMERATKDHVAAVVAETERCWPDWRR